METSPDNGFVSQLLALADQFDCPMTSQQAAACLRYTRTLLAWNRKTNLTRITHIEDLLAKHLLDALIPARWLPDHGRALDIGSGAGVPAIPLQIVRPRLNFVLLESLRKKASFLKVCVAELGLSNTSVLQSRWQDFASTAVRSTDGCFDLITMRAFKPTPDLLSQVSETILAEHGRFAFWGGPGTSDAEFQTVVETIPGLDLLAVHRYGLPYGAGIRQLVLWEKRRV